VITQGIEVPEGCNDLRRMQLRELAQLNGTLRETDGMRCSNCGSTEHKSWLCPDKPNVTNNIVCSACGGAGHIAKDCKSKRPGLGGVEGSNNQAKIDEEYMSLMAELGEVQPEAAQAREPQPPPSRPYNIFDTPRHQQQPRAIGPPSQPSHSHVIPSGPLPPMSGPPPAWHHQPAPPPPHHQPAPPHPMGSYPPPMHHNMNSHGWPPAIPPLPGQIPMVSLISSHLKLLFLIVI
jgi:splicing factor 1